MKKQMSIAAMMLAAGLSAQAVDVLTDSFDAGGVTTDLNQNLANRQEGLSSTVGYSTYLQYPEIVNNSKLTAGGELHLIAIVPGMPTVENNWGQVVVRTESMAPHIGDSSFSVQVRGKVDTTYSDVTPVDVLSVFSDANDNWDASPMSVVIYPSAINTIELHYGSIDNTFGSAAGNLSVSIHPPELEAGLGKPFDPTEWHTYEIRASAESETNGTWGLVIDGVPFNSGLSYRFEDANLRVAWTATNKADHDTSWDDLKVSLLSISGYEYVFRDTFDIPDTGNVNAGLVDRQAEGLVPSGYNNYADLPADFSISGNTLYCEGNGAGLRSVANYAPYIVGNDFELSFNLTVDFDGSDWAAVYLVDASGSIWNTNDFGFHARGTGSDSAFILNDLSRNDGGANLFEVTVAEVEAATGKTYDKTQEHLIQFVSSTGTGGTNSYDFVVDGAVVKADLKYYFPDNTVRMIDIWTSFSQDGGPFTGGAYIDDLTLRIPATYEQWAESVGLTIGVDDGRGDDPDCDGMDNLLEYALGGNPLVIDDATVLPIWNVDASLVTYVYARRTDAASRGLGYDFRLGDNLVVGFGSAGDTYATVTPVDSAFEQVSNSIPVSALSSGFIDLKISED